jgi:hypothetical protein
MKTPEYATHDEIVALEKAFWHAMKRKYGKQTAALSGKISQHAIKPWGRRWSSSHFGLFARSMDFGLFAKAWIDLGTQSSRAKAWEVIILRFGHCKIWSEVKPCFRQKDMTHRSVVFLMICPTGTV